MKIAIGMVIAIENTPHGLCCSARTTTRASTAMMITMIIKTPTRAAAPPVAPSSSRAIWPRVRPRRRVEIHNTR